jgi:trans-2,3-dihydro-3-hydroxyanthranilate isomerase
MNRQLKYVTADVFTRQRFGGNPIAVVLDGRELSTAQMQSIAAEFNYSETTFILPPRERRHAAHVRIFTPRSEVPFAGHPNIGTAVVLARELARGELELAGCSPTDERWIFEEAAGLVHMRLIREDGVVIGAELQPPKPLSRGATISVEDAAACLSLAPSDIAAEIHAPQIVSVGLPFLVAAVSSRAALQRAKASLPAHERVLRAIGTDAVFLYCHEESPGRLRARMFAPLDGIVEDPATGSAAAATIAHLASLERQEDAEREWQIEQGVEMGRASTLRGHTVKRAGALTEVRLSGDVVTVMRGIMEN